MSEPEEPGTGTGLDDLLDVLSSPIDDDDAELTAVLTRRPRAKLPSLTLILLAIVVASAGFLGGALVGKHYGSSGSGNLAAAFRGLAAARTGASSSASAGTSTGTGARSGFPGGAGGGFGGGNATIGTIKLIDGATVYVQTTAGDVVQVATSAGTKVTVSSTVPVKDLKPGETVIVEGSKNSSGAIAATSISQTSLGGGFGGGAGGGG
ncbi:MAG: hypothetical protein ACRDPD_32550 [Streptosporangiaceae bacterium]